MKKLPNAVKWLIIAVALALFAALAFAVNDRASRVEMPPPDDTFGIYRTGGADSHAHQVCCGDVLFLHFIFDGCCDIRQNFLSAVILDRRDLPFVQHLSFVIEQS